MSERIVFDAIKKNLSDEWYVFHSFDYVTRDLNKKRWDGEIDFLLYHPQKGMLVIEVKGGANSSCNESLRSPTGYFTQRKVNFSVRTSSRSKNLKYFQ